MTTSSQNTKLSKGSDHAKSLHLPYARHVVCFWKQNDLGLYSRRPDRWIRYWNAHPDVERVWVVEPPVNKSGLNKWLDLATQNELAPASEFSLLLDQFLRKRQGACDHGKVKYLSYLAADNEMPNVYNQWLKTQLTNDMVSAPLVLLWPTCLITTSLIYDLKPSNIVTDLVDDQRQFKGNAKRAEQIDLQYQALLRLSDRVISNSHGLIDSFEEEFGRKIEYLPNEHLPTRLTEGGNLQAFQKRLFEQKTKPVAGYLGNMRERIDVHKLVKTILACPNWDFWFVGQTHGSVFYKVAKGFENCHFFGVLKAEMAEKVGQVFDIGLLPFVDNELTQSMSFLKSGVYKKQNKRIIDFRDHTLNEVVVLIRELTPSDMGKVICA